MMIKITTDELIKNTKEVMENIINGGIEIIQINIKKDEAKATFHTMIGSVTVELPKIDYLEE